MVKENFLSFNPYPNPINLLQIEVLDLRQKAGQGLKENSSFNPSPISFALFSGIKPQKLALQIRLVLLKNEFGQLL